MGISRIFDISSRSMATYQRALDVTSHNIANASNPGYSRQRVVLSTERPELLGNFEWGTGVKIDYVTRARNGLIDAQLRVNQQTYSDNNQRSVLLGQVEELFTEPSDLGLSNLMTNFFNSWQELAVTPNSTPLRTNVINSAQQISTKVQSIIDGLDITRNDVLTDAKAKVSQLNSLIGQVQVLNKQIFESETIGNSASDLHDKRDEVLEELSKIVNVNISYDSDNSAIVSVGGVFAADRSNSIEFELAEKNGKLTLLSKGSAQVNLTGGEMNALSQVFSVDIPSYQAKIDEIMKIFTEAVNTEHMKGYTLTNPPQTGVKFFNDYQSGQLTVSQDILNNPKLIAASSDGTEGNSSIATNIGEIINKKLINGASIMDAYSSLMSEMGNDVLRSTQVAESTVLVIQSLENQRASYSGVSIDEEMANVIKFQKAYEASAKLIGVADELMDTLLNLV